VRVFIRICDFLFVCRPVILIPAWSFYLIGAAAGIDSHTSPHGFIPSPLTLACLTAILVTAYLLNQVFDTESDARNNKCLFIARGIIGTRTVVFMAVVFFLAASVAYRRVDAIHRIPLFVALLLSLLYSLPPIRLCARPFLDMFANAVGYGGVAFVLGFNIYGPSINSAGWLAAPYILLVAATFLHTTILDYDGDRDSGKKSTSVLIGLRASTNLAGAFHMAAFVLALISAKPAAILITGITLPIVVYTFVNRSRRASSILIQANTLIVTIAAAVTWPLYLAVVIPLILLSRFYHARRFGITYPGAAPGAKGS
jgi:4-hydroxybenzoate polyprenyltransferase